MTDSSIFLVSAISCPPLFDPKLLLDYSFNPPANPHSVSSFIKYNYHMNKNPNIAETWGIPDDQANKVREALSKKSIRPEDRVQVALEEMARDIALIEPDPSDWSWWVGYLLEQMELQAEKHQQIKQYE